MEPDTTNEFSIDIERYQLTYRVNDYFSVSGGRFHTAIGYYNTAYHHGNWFSTAEGRPIMYLFEDSGGVLPVHTVGVTMTGLVPQTGNLGLHWIAEIGNGRRSNPARRAGPELLFGSQLQSHQPCGLYQAGMADRAPDRRVVLSRPAGPRGRSASSPT